MTPNVPINDSGIVTLGITVAQKLRRKEKITITTSAMVIIIVNCTSFTEARMVCVLSPTMLSLAADGSDAVSADIGGGLCQISGLLYETGLRAGLEIVERHAHTQDLYTDETRFTALGLDATVVWGHKDVRLRNTTGQSLAFNFEVTTEQIRARLWSEQPIDIAEVSIVSEKREGGGQRVSVFREIRTQRTLISSDLYKPADQTSGHLAQA